MENNNDSQLIDRLNEAGMTFVGNCWIAGRSNDDPVCYINVGGQLIPKSDLERVARNHRKKLAYENGGACKMVEPDFGAGSLG